MFSVRVCLCVCVWACLSAHSIAHSRSIERINDLMNVRPTEPNAQIQWPKSQQPVQKAQQQHWPIESTHSFIVFRSQRFDWIKLIKQSYRAHGHNLSIYIDNKFCISRFHRFIRRHRRRCAKRIIFSLLGYHCVFFVSFVLVVVAVVSVHLVSMSNCLIMWENSAFRWTN